MFLGGTPASSCDEIELAQYFSNLVLKNDFSGLQMPTSRAQKPMAGQWMSSCYRYFQENEHDLVKSAWDGVRSNLEKHLPHESTNLRPVTYSNTKCVSKFLMSISPSQSRASKNPIQADVVPVLPAPVLSLKSITTPTVIPTTSTPPPVSSQIEDSPDDDSEDMIKENNFCSLDEEVDVSYDSDEYAPAALIGKRISVFWNDADGRRWENGMIKDQHSPVKFIVTYDFMLEEQKTDEDVDPDVIENLLGKKAVNWRFE